MPSDTASPTSGATTNLLTRSNYHTAHAGICDKNQPPKNKRQFHNQINKMKKLSILLLTGTLLCLSGGCDSYRNRDTRIAISYLCVGQDDMFELYDITATYSDGKGRVHTSPVTSFPWKVEYSYMPLGPCATRNQFSTETSYRPKRELYRRVQRLHQLGLPARRRRKLLRNGLL